MSGPGARPGSSTIPNATARIPRACANASSTNVYLAVGGNLTISSAELYQDVGPAEDWNIDGSFSGTFQDNETPPNTVTINSTFSGINIKVN